MNMLLHFGFHLWWNSEVDYEVNLAKFVDIQTGHYNIHLIQLVLGILIIALELIFLQLSIDVVGDDFKNQRDLILRILNISHALFSLHWFLSGLLVLFIPIFSAVPLRTTASSPAASIPSSSSTTPSTISSASSTPTRLSTSSRGIFKLIPFALIFMNHCIFLTEVISKIDAFLILNLYAVAPFIAFATLVIFLARIFYLLGFPCNLKSKKCVRVNFAAFFVIF